MSEPKRAKFSHPQVSRVPILEAPKTSEYAFFKKLKKDIGCTESRSLHKENTQSKISKLNGQNRDFPEASAYSCILRSSSSSGKEGPSKKFAFLSPIGIESNNLSKGTSNGIKKRSSLLCGHVVGCDQNLIASPYTGAGENLGNQYAEKGAFYVQRQRLHQLAADLFPDAGDCNSKGFDLVSALINRLLPKGNEIGLSLTCFSKLDTLEKTVAQNASKIQGGSCSDDVSPRYQLGRLREKVLSKPWGIENEQSNSEGRMIDAEYPSAAFLNLDTCDKTSPQNAFKIQDKSCWNDAFPDYQSCSPRERDLSKWVMTASDLPCIKYQAETDSQDEEANYNCQADGGIIQYTFPENDSSFCLMFQNCSRSGADHIKQLHSFHAPQLDCSHALNEAAREASLLLRWDVKDDEGKNSYFTSGNSLDFACQQVMGDNIEEIMTWSSSLRPNQTLDFLLRPFVHSTCSYMHDMGGNHLDDSAVADALLFPLNLSLPTKHLPMEEDWDRFNHFENSNINLPQQDPPWCTSKVHGKKGDSEALLSEGLDNDLGWKCLPKRDFLEYYSSNNCIFHFPFKEDLHSYAVEQDEETALYCTERERTLASYDGALGILDCSSASQYVSLGKRMDDPLLFDYPDRERTEEVIYFDNDIQWRSN